MDDLAKALSDGLRGGASLEELFDVLRKHRDAGAAQPDVARVLEGLRSAATSEGEEDRILELMDFVHGFCAPHMKLY